jgi:hypothetical protein
MDYRHDRVLNNCWRKKLWLIHHPAGPSVSVVDECPFMTDGGIAADVVSHRQADEGSGALRTAEQKASAPVRVWHTLNSLQGIHAGWQVVAFLIAMFAVFSRHPGSLLHPQFFAEDGWVWYQQAYNLHWARSLLIPQAGFLQLFPRLVAGVALLVPMQWAPLVMNGFGAVIQALPVTVLLSQRASSWGPLPVRMMMAATYIATPNAPEIHVVLTNAMWHLALIEVLIAFSLPPRGWRGGIADVLLFAVGCVSGPFSILLLPLVAAYWWMRRNRWTIVLLGILCAGALVQAMALLHAARAAGAPLGATLPLLLRIVAGNIFVNSMTGTGGGHLQFPILLIAGIGGIAILVWAWRIAPASFRLFAIFALLVLAASLRDPLLLSRVTPRWQVLADVAGIRYWFFPSILFLWSALWCAFGGTTRLPRLAGVGVLVLSTIGIFRQWVYPPWPAGHYTEDVERFQKLRSGDHMSFDVYDPGNRPMELIKQ